MSTLPRFKPKDLYDLAQQVAIVRPGPIVGNLVHPLIQRRDDPSLIDYIHPSLTEKLEPILKRTCGVILFQEQMIAIAMELAGFTGAEAEELRRAMGFTKDENKRLDKIKAKLRAHLENRSHPPHVVEKIVEAVSAFAFYGFPESHAISFALLAYASTWLKTHRIAEFTASLLNNQPMGFYSPATILQDARRHPFNLKVRAVCVRHSDWKCKVEAERALRLGLLFIKGLRERAVLHMMTARAEKPFASLADFLARTIFTPGERRVLASVGALNVFAGHRRAALWQAEAAWSSEETLFNHATLLENAPADLPSQSASKLETHSDGHTRLASDLQRPAGDGSNSPLEGDVPSAPNPSFHVDFGPSPLSARAHADFPLRPMSLPERLGADFAGMSLTAGAHPMATVRAQLPDVTPANELIAALDGHTITIAGSVICRQRPGTAKGVVFISLEDETGIANSVVYAELFERMRLTITQESALLITGKLQHKAGVAHVRAEKIAPLRLSELPTQASHDFH